MSFLDLLFIAPLVLIYEHVFLFLISTTQNYLLSLVALSLTHSLLFLPFRHMAATIQAKEQRIMKILAPEIARIKLESKGRDRHNRIAKFYRRYGYHPAYAIRSSATILLQVPFISATYFMLSNLEIIRGKSIYFLADIGKPDALLWGVNLLPIVMTLVNAAAILSTKNMARREQAQAGVVAVLFLILLYKSPAALMLFWTFNNVVSLAQNFVRRPHLNANTTFDFMRTLAARLDTGNNGLIYALSVATLALLLCVFGPSALYFSDPGSFFGEGVFSVLKNSLPLLGVFAVVSTFVWYVAGKSLRPLLTMVMLFVTLCSLIFAFSTFPDFGVLSGFSLSKYEDVRVAHMNVADATTLLASALLVTLLYRSRKLGILPSFLSLISASLLFYPFYESLVASSKAKAETKSKNEELTNLRESLSFTKTGKNVLYIILDAFTGSHIRAIFNEYPELEREFSGFTWYPDTLATGSCTIVGLPPMLGGVFYTAAEMNKRRGQSNIDKVNRAYAQLPNAFSRQGFQVSIINELEEFSPVEFYSHIEQRGKVRVVSDAKALTFKKETLKSKTDYYPLAVALFRMVPNLARRHIYAQGRWLGAIRRNSSFASTRREVEFLRSLPRLSTASATENTLRIIKSNLTHAPYHLTKETIEYVDDPYPATTYPVWEENHGVSPEHFYTETHAVRFLTEYFHWMRNEKVFDNTHIIVASDHSFADSARLEEVFASKGAFPDRRPDALLLVKEPYATNTFKESPLLMSTADIPSLLCGGIDRIHCESVGMFSTDKNLALSANEQRERTVVLPTSCSLKRLPSNELPLIHVDTVTGSMFKRENWHKVMP